MADFQNDPATAFAICLDQLYDAMIEIRALKRDQENVLRAMNNVAERHKTDIESFVPLFQDVIEEARTNFHTEVATANRAIAERSTIAHNEILGFLVKYARRDHAKFVKWEADLLKQNKINVDRAKTFEDFVAAIEEREARLAEREAALKIEQKALADDRKKLASEKITQAVVRTHSKSQSYFQKIGLGLKKILS